MKGNLFHMLIAVALVAGRMRHSNPSLFWQNVIFEFNATIATNSSKVLSSLDFRRAGRGEQRHPECPVRHNDV
jgi:hypothetical protein